MTTLVQEDFFQQQIEENKLLQIENQLKGTRKKTFAEIGECKKEIAFLSDVVFQLMEIIHSRIE